MPDTGTIRSCSIAGCTTTNDLFVAASTPTGIAAAAGFVYWGEDGLLEKCAAGPSCAAPTPIAASPSPPAYAVAVDATGVYWPTASDGRVHACPLAGCGTARHGVAGRQSRPPGTASH